MSLGALGDETERRRRRRTVGWTLVLAGLTAVLGWGVGVSWVQSALLFTGVTTVGAALLALDQLDDDARLPALDPPGRSEGTRREVSRLSWSLAGADNRVGGRPYVRLRAIAANRLALRGIDPSEPAGAAAARALLTPLGYDQLVAETAAPPTQRVFAACITLLEQLDDAPGSPSGGTGDSSAPIKPQRGPQRMKDLPMKSLQLMRQRRKSQR